MLTGMYYVAFSYVASGFPGVLRPFIKEITIPMNDREKMKVASTRYRPLTLLLIKKISLSNVVETILTKIRKLLHFNVKKLLKANRITRKLTKN